MSHAEMVTALLMTGQHRIDPVAAGVAKLPATEVAAALAAGEPQRAERRLGDLPDDGDTAVLGYAATVLDHQWTPRGAGSALADDTAGALAAAGRRLTDTARDTPLGALATTVLPELLVAQAMSADERRSGLAALAGRTRDRLASIEREWPALGPAAQSYATLAQADLAFRDGDVTTATRLLGEARSYSGGDAAAQAHMALTRGDWFADPFGHPDTLGLAFGASAALDRAPLTANAAAQAAEYYAEADLLWSAIGSRSGTATVAMRRAHLARTLGDTTTRDEELARAHRLATEAGDGGLTALIEVHRLTDVIATDRHADQDRIDPVRRWSETDGSRSYHRGLVHLLAVRARRWRDDGDFTRARATLALADRLAGPDGYRHDGASVSIDLAALYGGTGYRRARFAFADIELAEALSTGRIRTAVEWVRLAVRATELNTEANVQADPELVATAAGRIQEVIAAPVQFDDDEADMVVAAHHDLTGQLRSAPATIAWFYAQQLRDAGDEDQALAAFGTALDRSGHDPLLQCAVMTSVPLRAGALELARLLEPHLPPLPATRLYVRLEEPDAAERLIGRVEPVPPPWTRPALLAGLCRLQQRHAEQARHAAEAVDLFEQRQNDLARDLLRSAATDDWTVAEAYRDLVTGLLAGGRVIEALAAADRARGLPAALLTDLATLPAASRRDAGDWLAANSRWAAAFEEPQDRRRTVLDAAEATLDAAEEQVRRTAPELLEKRVAQPGDLSGTVRRLPTGTALLAYHHFRGELVGWAVTGDGTVRTCGPITTENLTGVIAGWHRALRRGHTDPHAAQRLSDLLLSPFRTVLENHQRIVVVPDRDLSLVPFHALPWADGVLGDRHDVSTLPAVALLDRPGTGRPVDLNRGVVLLGDPDSRSGLPPLPGTRCEILGIQRHLPDADLLLGPQATLAGLRTLATGRGVVHLASHAIVRPGQPNLSNVVLAGDDRLTVADLLGGAATGELLVLSACQTAQGTSTRAGDMSGLVRATLIAGFAHVVATLWPVQDQIAAVVMERFYAHLVPQGDVSHALAEAQREVRAMAPADLTDAYASLPGADPRHAAAMRDASVAGLHLPDPAHGWAAFTHVGFGGPR
ncbi:CHAT domain-containing protein [Actinoplanes sichuanensis]|uniref:CHAT domain-containing protein n=2 Tax=Actinoplanes sichuanensis TaxID=512349 RepID=A0ABW4AAE1_9ACTN|nr:CHAT domain-containing protein [Actinoplanes sichuanensis]